MVRFHRRSVERKPACEQEFFRAIAVWRVLTTRRSRPLSAACECSASAARLPFVSGKAIAETPRVRGMHGRLALTKAEAATALGISVDSFERHVQPELRMVRRGKLRLFDVRELERWLEESSARALAS
jgi:hypothetical protein